MKIKTFYWNDRIYNFLEYYYRVYFRNQTNCFLHGNAGDLFCSDLIKNIYDTESVNLRSEGSRLLLIGSISHAVREGDVICGIGTKVNTIPKDVSRNVLIHGVRGPITYEVLKKGGFDMSNVKFMLDPGLLINRILPQSYKNIVAGDNVSFIPHYREKFEVRKNLPKGLSLIDIDNRPEVVAKSILESKMIYSSSLHGIIFAHALNRPCVFVKPQTEEPLIKFEDYYESVGMVCPKPLGRIQDYLVSKKIETVLNKKVCITDFYFPTKSELLDKNVFIN